MSNRISVAEDISPGGITHIWDYHPRGLQDHDVLCMVTRSRCRDFWGPATLADVACENCKAIYRLQLELCQTEHITRDDLHHLRVALESERLENGWARQRSEIAHLIAGGLWEDRASRSGNPDHVLMALTEHGREVARAAWVTPYVTYGFDPMAAWPKRG